MRAVRLNQNKELKKAKLMKAAESGVDYFLTMSDTFYIQEVTWSIVNILFFLKAALKRITTTFPQLTLRPGCVQCRQIACSSHSHRKCPPGRSWPCGPQPSGGGCWRPAARSGWTHPYCGSACGSDATVFNNIFNLNRSSSTSTSHCLSWWDRPGTAFVPERRFTFKYILLDISQCSNGCRSLWLKISQVFILFIMHM